MQEYEKLGMFYLGREYDMRSQKTLPEPLLYDAKDLTTHAVCVGMTGSGKTGLCIGLLEEAAIDNIPAIVIDPKGDIANLLLTFPDLKGEDFLPWINEEDARKKRLTPEAYAGKQADLWKNGLAKWDQDGARIKRFRESTDLAVYTPGSTAGLPVSILSSFAAPSAEVIKDTELLRERISTTATCLLSLLGIEADPIRSREHILISTLLSHAWNDGQDLDLAALIHQIQAPPVTKIGVLNLDSFYPAKDRFELAMSLNNLLAAPGFESWLQGDGLDVDNLLYTADGKPRISIFSIAHLSDAERMFFVALLLNQIVGWMRGKSGTSSLRALVYMDEIFGFLPPTANPASKTPMLTLLKQARAFGVGMVLATQNPVDLDYKALSNAGTWFIGRLQTERDKNRMLDGLEGAAASAAGNFDRGEMEALLAGLGKRVFLMNNVHESAPAVFNTRWVLSYLRGPLTRTQIKTLMAGKRKSAEKSGKAAPGKARKQAAAPAASRPVLAKEILQRYLPARGDGDQLVYQPQLFADTTIQYRDARKKIDSSQDVLYLHPVPESAMSLEWDAMEPAEFDTSEFERKAEPNAAFLELPSPAHAAKSYGRWQKDIQSLLYRNEALTLWTSKALKLTSQAGESARDFRVRVREASHEVRDEAVDKLRKKYDTKIRRLEDRIRRAQHALERETVQAKQQKYQTIMSFGTTLLGAVLGRKTVSATTIRRASTGLRGVGRSMKEAGDVARAEENLEVLRGQLADLEAEVREEIDALHEEFEALPEAIEEIALRPKKTNISIDSIGVLWVPHWRNAQGILTPAWG